MLVEAASHPFPALRAEGEIGAVECVYIADTTARTLALLSGDVDMIESPPIQDLSRITDAGFKVVDALSNRIIYLHMDQEGEAPSISGTT